ncbi:diacylglycerol kinase theta-like, partial [Stegastes partitus]|uniref:Diacylglycerol kinase theta-like n=1 Tax=Stegastes partitus TaxID=144197 RepID=A0A9Y4U4A7_9TELE
LHTFREVPRFRVLVCGGDGTVGWVLGVLEAVRHKLVCREPPIGIVPLGTGNDLARILRWGPGYSSEDPQHILVSVDEADEVLMDRWTILLDAQDFSEDGKDNGFLEPPKVCLYKPVVTLKEQSLVQTCRSKFRWLEFFNSA